MQQKRLRFDLSTRSIVLEPENTHGDEQRILTMVYSTLRRVVTVGSSRGERCTVSGEKVGRGCGGIDGGDEWMEAESSSGRDREEVTGDDEGLDDAEGSEVTRSAGELEPISVEVGIGRLKEDGTGDDETPDSRALGDEEGTMGVFKGWSPRSLFG